MTRDEIILQLAEQAGLHDVLGSWCQECGCTNDMLLRFAELVVSAEREACAVAAWSTGMGLHMKAHDAREIGSACAKAIRARGMK